jgi:hypothetical protein
VTASTRMLEGRTYLLREPISRHIFLQIPGHTEASQVTSFLPRFSVAPTSASKLQAGRVSSICCAAVLMMLQVSCTGTIVGEGDGPLVTLARLWQARR